MIYQKPKGTYDLFGQEAKYFNYIEKVIKIVTNIYNYNYIRTPGFEQTELYHRGTGETTDIVSKETYNFIDRSNRKMTLRPEGTPGVVRSYIENKMYADSIQPTKLYYLGPMYRYERPQSGRFREHFQFGVEVFGSDDPMIDAEVISIAVNIFKRLGLENIKVYLNTLGDYQSRMNYRQALLDYFKPHLDDLCEDCKTRYERNPLRILDCKIDAEKEILKNVPKIDQYLTKESNDYFQKVKKYLKTIGIKYEVKPTLVRGLDYYTNTVFEIEIDSKEFGTHNVLCGGGRYNSLVETLGGPSTPGIGFGMGIERLIKALKDQNIDLNFDEEIDLFVIYLSENEKDEVFKLVHELRDLNYKTEMDYMNRNLKGQFKQADKLKAKYIIIIGEDEIKNKFLTVKNNLTKEEYKIRNEDLNIFLMEKLKIERGLENE